MDAQLFGRQYAIIARGLVFARARHYGRRQAWSCVVFCWTKSWRKITFVEKPHSTGTAFR